MEVIIAEGGGACLFCDYSGTRLRPEWYRGTSFITDGNTMDPCDCAVSETDNQELCFESITNMAVGEDYSCQIPTGVGQVDTCSFSVKLAGELKQNRNRVDVCAVCTCVVLHIQDVITPDFNEIIVWVCTINYIAV